MEEDINRGGSGGVGGGESGRSRVLGKTGENRQESVRLKTDWGAKTIAEKGFPLTMDTYPDLLAV